MTEDDLLAEQPNLQNKTPPIQKWLHDFRFEKVGPAFWTVTGCISLVVNLVLILLVITLSRQIFSLKALVQDQLVSGLYTSFQQMDTAHIRTTIPISTQVPAKFDLPLKTNTVVTLTEDTTISQATIYEFTAGNLYISRAATNIILPAGTKLPVQLDLTVPVDQQIPVNLMVEVDIPLEQTELHEPFTNLQHVIEPYYTLLNGLPSSWTEVVCGPEPSSLCSWFIH